MNYKIWSSLCALAVMLSVLASSAAAVQFNTGQEATTERFADKNGFLSDLSNQSKNEAAAIEILEKNVTAIGGRDAFVRIKSVETHSEQALMGRTSKMRRIVDVTNKRTYERQENGSRIFEQGFDGQRAWQKNFSFRGYLDPTAPSAKALMRNEINLPGTILYNYQENNKKYLRLPDEQINGKSYLVVKSSSTDVTGKEVETKYYFDAETYLIKQIVSGNAITQTTSFEDYRQVDGRTIAFTSTITNPQFSANRKITELKFDVPVNASLFEFQEAAEERPATALPSAPSATEQANKTESPTSFKADDKLSESLRLATFERVWKTVNDTFWDRTFNNVNWQSVHEKYLPLAKTIQKNDDFHKLLNQMVQELHLSHFRVVPPGSVLSFSTNKADLRNGSTGLRLKWIENQLLVSNVIKESSAEVAGVKPGFVLQRINGKTPNELYAEYQKNNPGYQFREELARVRAISGELAGKPDTKVELELTDASDKLLKLELSRKALPLNTQLEFESKKLDKDTGYIKFNLFFGDLINKFQSALRELRETKALVIDLRGNPGGAGDLAPALAKLLCAQPGSLGSFKFRYESEQYSYQGTGEQAYQGQIVLLVDAATGSTAEVFSSGLQTNKRAVVVGSRTAGAVLPSLNEALPTGGALQYVVATFQTTNGTTIEGLGVSPDIAVQVSRRGLLAGRDEILERAINFIKK